MYPLRRLILAMLFGLLFAEQAAAQQAAARPLEITAHRDLQYARVDDLPLRLDLFVPQSERPPPLVVWIHGGAWLSGSKAGAGQLRPLTRHGYAVASIDYRLSSQAIFPAQIHDCKAAIRWLRANAARYGYDSSRIGIAGSSAGGHLVALLGTSGGVKLLEGEVGDHRDQSSRVQAVCDLFGPTDFLQMDAHALPGAPFAHNAADSPEAKLIGGPIQDNPQLVARANPITYVDKDDPPFLIVHGGSDPLVPVHQSRLLTEALKQASVPVTLQVIPGAGHGGRQFSTPEVQATILAFFDKHIKRGDAPR